MILSILRRNVGQKYNYLKISNNMTGSSFRSFPSNGLRVRGFHSFVSKSFRWTPSTLDGRGMKSKFILEKPYKCTHDGCDQGFVSQAGLDKHLPQHDMSRKFVCVVCKLRFGHKSSLKRHERTHTGEKPYKCIEPDCEYACKRSDNLTKHKRIHSGEKPYKCDEPDCDYACTQSSHLTKHKRAKH